MAAPCRHGQTNTRRVAVPAGVAVLLGVAVPLRVVARSEAAPLTAPAPRPAA
jgi:hypothetical protein